MIQLNVGGGDGSYDVAVQSDGKIVAAGYSGTSFSPYTNGFAMVRLTTSGTLDSTFGSGGKVSNSTFTSGSSDSAFGLSIQSDGTIVLAGSSAGDFALARYTSAGSLDTSFGTAGTGRVKTDFGGTDGSYAVARDAAGRFVLAGFTDADMALARYHGVTQAATSGTQRQWVQQDANFNVTSVAGDDGAVLERYRYTPYGERTVLNAAGTAAVAGNASAIGNPFGHQGGRIDAATGLCFFNIGGKGRSYLASLGRWTSRDASGYVDGASVYQYVISNPLAYLDSQGNQAGAPPPTTQPSVVPQPGLGTAVNTLNGNKYPFIPGRGTFTASLIRNDDYSSAVSIRFKPSEAVTKGCLCTKIEFVQYVMEFRNGVRKTGVPGNAFVLDQADPYPHQTSWTGGPGAAIMGDSPGASNRFRYWQTTPFLQWFVTFAVCKSGKEAGKSYGSIQWVHAFTGGTPDVVYRAIEGSPSMSSGDPANSRVDSGVIGYAPTE